MSPEIGPHESPTSGIHFRINTMLYCDLAVIMGIRSILCSLLTERFSIREGIKISRNQFTEKANKIPTDLAISMGFLLLIVSLGGLSFFAWDWMQQKMGRLNPTEVRRWVLPLATMCVIGLGVMLFGFFYGVLMVPRMDRSYLPGVSQCESKAQDL